MLLRKSWVFYKKYSILTIQIFNFSDPVFPTKETFIKAKYVDQAYTIRQGKVGYFIIIRFIIEFICGLILERVYGIPFSIVYVFLVFYIQD